MADIPVTPPSKQNGNGLQDPFTDEKNGDHLKSNGSEGGDGEKNKDQDADEEDIGEEIPMLFYAYARRSDNYWASRYLLTFSSAHTCNEWWSLIQTEYPEQGTRHGPQLFSFVGDDFLRKPATSKKFEHLKTKWFYSQFGDASGTGGRAQEIIPLQDWEGRIVAGPRVGGDIGEGEVKKRNKSKGKAIEIDDEDDEYNDRKRDRDPFDFSALAESLQSAASIAEMNNAQVSQLAESQSLLQSQHENTQHATDRLQRIEALVEENAAQLQALSKSHIKAQQQNRELAEQNARILRELKRQRTQAQTLLEQVVNRSEQGKEGEREKEQGEIEGVHVVVHPPPRKIDRVLVGYAYHSGGADAAAANTAAKDGAAKGPPAKRPVVGNRTTSSATGPKSASGK